MLKRLSTSWTKTRNAATDFFKSPACLAFLPAICLGLFWFGGEVALMVCAIAFPLIFVVSGARAAHMDAASANVPLTGLVSRETFTTLTEEAFRRTRETGLNSALFEVEIDEHDALIDHYGRTAADAVVATVGERIASVMRSNDATAQTGEFQFSICVAPVARLDLELCIQLAGRIQAAIEAPIAVDGATVYLTACVGFCQHTRVISRAGSDWADAAHCALREAQHNGNNSIRAFSDEMRRKSQNRSVLRSEVCTALERGHIQPWFQPQISTDTGLVTGFEALARWNHPNRGMVAPADFLPAIEQAGQLERLAEVMMYHSFTALKAWDSAGVVVPHVGVNFAGPELSNPNLVDKIKWELDRFELAPKRLVVEVLETVVAGAPDDMITRNINGLSKLGCRIDLDDFGTGHASIASIRRFSVSRIKIDRSFVMKADRDPDQQRMVSAILTMAERLEVETLAEGVETVGEHALLAQLGCDHVQGFGIGKPMPFDQTLDWITRHNAKLQAAPQILGKKSG
ncbi:MAG: bifunctional diguanylate cyclase/phosphodiesterase [Roseobacter sp.]|jgi:diguanylate cyclase (GGDEF)-like protein|nr:bifunctional diguanylate cyclase/phosphodiesterase [Roseobacter sp.]